MNKTDITLDQVIALKLQIKALEHILDEALDELRTAVDEGDLDPQFTHDDVAFDLRAGRTTYSYPADVITLQDQLKQAQADAVAAGTAIAKTGNPFWVIKLPKP